jgi:YidC/Oxa1 family membrane protein insertase
MPYQSKKKLNHLWLRCCSSAILNSPLGLWLVIAVLGSLCLPETFFASIRPSVETDTIQILWDDEYGDIINWEVRVGQPDGRPSWYSLVTRDGSGQVVSRHLSIKDKSVKDSLWSTTPPGYAKFKSQYAGNRLLIERHFYKTDMPYRLRMEIYLKNISDQVLTDVPLAFVLGPGLGEYPIDGLGVAESLYSYVQPVYLIDGKVSSFDIKSGDRRHRIDLKNKKCQWAGLQSRYFALLLAPVNHSDCKAVEYCFPESSTIKELPKRYLPEILIFLDVTGIEPGEVWKKEFIIFSGPKSLDTLDTGSEKFRKILFSGQWQGMRILCFALLWILKAIHAVIPSWGVSILMLALLVRVLIYPLARKMMADQQKFANVQLLIGPEIKKIKKKYRGEEQSEKILGLYKKHGVSPFTGMKPLVIVVIQLPVFIALFHALGQAAELQDASFLWINTLGLPDQLFSFGQDLPLLGAYFNLLPFLWHFRLCLQSRFHPCPAKTTYFWQ